MKRNIDQELLDDIETTKGGGGVRHAVELPEDAKAIREKTGLSQSAFAGVLSARKKTNQGVKVKEEGMSATLIKLVDHLLEQIKELEEENKELKIRLAIEESSQNGKKRHDRPTLKVVHIRTKAASAE
jgi:hypothetical protein